MIALVDYGMGNLHSVAKALERVGGRVRLARAPEALDGAERIVLPGVGAFRDCMATLRERGLDAAITARIAAGAPFLGICLGMQALMDVSFEFGEHRGLGLIPGEVRPFPAGHPVRGFKIPHMGWNDAEAADPAHPVLAALAWRQVYYVHSYYCAPRDPAHRLADCDYGGVRFAAAIGRDNIVGVQFHPEKSQRAGLALLEAFIQWRP
ncbi:MAG: imidazole glycerol phosphate synthase subunit HisH [Mariprofundaceae bacterium]